jgi:nucleoside-diphosphate-sugar epimerase
MLKKDITFRENRVNSALIIGCGDLGRRVAALLNTQGISVAGLVRSEESREQLANLNISALAGNLDLPEDIQPLPLASTTVFYFAPPPGGGIIDTRARNFCQLVTDKALPEKIVYLSTSGVYGDCGDKIVTESTPPAPGTARGKRRLDAEDAFRSLATTAGIPLVILRVTGIYGEGKLPYSQLQAGLPVLRDDESCITNRIHIDDLARICIAAAEQGEDGDTFNVSDGNPTTMTHYFNAVADALGLSRPPQVTREEALKVMTPLMLSYFSESRRMDNHKMLDKLGVKLLYPTLEDGLRASVSRQVSP